MKDFLLPDGISSELFTKFMTEFEKTLAEQNVIKIAVIGQAGVGKTTTINALFNTSLPVSHFEPCTQFADRFRTYTKKREPLDVIDMPGLLAGQAETQRHWETYKEVMPTVDSALWVVSAGDRALEGMQNSLKVISKFSGESILNRIVFGINKSEHMFPEDWNDKANLPSVEQTQNLERFTQTVRRAIREVFPRWNATIKYYSAMKHFRLDELLEQMLLAAPEERRLKLLKTADMLCYEDMVDPTILRLAQEELKRNQKK